MRKLYALFTGIFLTLLTIPSNALPVTPDVANFTFTVDHANKDVVFTNTSTLGNEPGIRLAFWSFGDGTGFWSPPLGGAQHQYQSPGTYNVCLKILRIRPNQNDSVVTAMICKTVVINVVCRADFEKLPPTVSNNPLLVAYRAIPWINNNSKPQKICWRFGDGTDTCINYPTSYTGAYIAYHRYNHPGLYEVCVNIQYYGGCEARKCKNIQVARPDTCAADFERIPSPVNNPLQIHFKALPQHNNNRKPARVCWNFGDGNDTCINYPETYTGLYTIGHKYVHPGNYEVCVKINYYGGCEARKCKNIQVARPDTCAADFERINTSGSPLRIYYKALPQHNNNRKPARICWNFGDGSDTCINYPETFTGQYTIGHRYVHPGNYEVCVKINYYGGCEARKCKNIQVARPDTCAADFERITANSSPLRAYFKALPQHNNNRKPARICWEFGDGSDTCINYPETFTGQYVTVHNYTHPGLFEVCVKIRYYGGCEARKCKNIQVGRPDTCAADFEKIYTSSSPLRIYYKALPQHNNNRKPARVCWNFGDGNDTCINYPETFTGPYAVGHNYEHPGLYEVCVKINYYGGCEARKCKNIQVGRQDTCAADFEKIPSTTPLLTYFRALPQHNNNRKPARICWRFGDGDDTCINYTESYSGPYVVGHRYNNAGTYEVCVNILYYGGCEARKCRPIVVPPPQQACTVRLFEITPSITSLVRGFLAVPHSTPPARPQLICWYFGDGEDTCITIDPNQPLPNFVIRHTYPAPGVYRACVRVRFQGGCVAEDCKEVVIRRASNMCGGFMVDSLMAPRTFKFRGYSIHAPNDEVLGYRWTFGDGTTAVGQDVTHTFANAGNYEVCLYIRTRLGCETRICKTLRIPGNNEPQLHLLPNPVVNTLYIDFFSTHTEQVNVRILNNSGMQVRSYVRNVTVGPNNWTNDVSSLVPGIYSFRVQSPNQLASALFIKQ